MRTVALYEMLFGIITLTGGIVGYLSTEDVVSLAAGIILGLILIIAALSMQKGSKTALYVELVATLSLLAQFGRDFLFENGTFIWSGLIAILGALSLLLLVALLLQPSERKRIF